MDTSANNSEVECAFACLPNNCNVQESALVTCCSREKGNKEKKSPPKVFFQNSEN